MNQSIHVETLIETGTGTCLKCGAENIVCSTLTVFAGTGNVDVGPFCTQCLVASRQFKIDVPQADMSPGKKPPTKRDKRQAQKQERRIAEDIGGKRQPGSGNQVHAKGDVRKKNFLRGEAKYTRSKQYILKREELDKISGECEGAEKPFMQIDFCHAATNRVEDSWVVIPYEDWKDLIDATSNNRGPGSTGGQS